MPYPYNNDLGKNPPQEAFHPSGGLFPIYGKPKKKAPEWASKPPTQAEMLEQLFGSKPGTLKFPKVLPLATTKDYPGNHPANKWGKPDPTMIADDKDSGPLEKQAQKLIEDMSKGIISKQEAYAQVWGKPKAIWEDTPSLPQPTTIEKLGPLLAEAYGFPLHKPAPQFLGKMMDGYNPMSHSYQINTVVKIDGLGVGDIKFGVTQNIADHAAFNMNTDMLSVVLDETFAKMKDEIMRKVIMEASKK